MAKKKINQIPKVNDDKFTGSYVQNLMNKQPAVPTVPVQSNNAIMPQAMGGNTYTSYVNGTNVKSPMNAKGSGGITPDGGLTIVPGDGSGGSSGGNTGGTSSGGSGTGAGGSTGGTGTEVPKTETGGTSEVESGSGTNGSSNKVSYPSYQSWLDTTKKQEESIVEQYNSAINYAEQDKKDAYKKAEDSYDIAMRDAQANFKTNQPTYGLTAEQLLASGLTGSGYSDYLAGKAYEARTDEINAARSQMNYAKYLADENYRDMMYQAEEKKLNRQDALEQWKLEYGVQLDAEYKAKVEEVIQGIMSGIYDASMGETILKNYASGGAVSEAVLAALKAADSNYWKATNSGVIADYINWIQSIEAAGGTVNPDMVRAYLKTSTNLSDQEIDTLVSYLGSGGKGPEDDPDNGGQGGDNPDNGGQGGNNPDTGGNTGNTGNTGNAGNSGNTGDSGEDKIKWYEAVLGVLASPFMIGSLVKSEKEKKQEELIADFTSEVDDGSRPTYADSFGIFKDAMNKHDIGEGSYYNELVEKMNELVKDGVDNGTIGKFNPVAAAVINEMVNGLYVSSGTFSSNDGMRKAFEKGDNFTVDMGDKNYRVESEGEASDTVKEASTNLYDGVVFGYGSELYVKSGDTAYKIRPRRMFGNKDYDELWKAVYGEALDSLASKAPTDAAQLNSLEMVAENNPYLYESYIKDKLPALTEKSATNQGKSTAIELPENLRDEDKLTLDKMAGVKKLTDAFQKLFSPPKSNSDFNKWLAEKFGLIKQNSPSSGNNNDNIDTGLEGMPSIMPGGQQGTDVTYDPADTDNDGTVSDEENTEYQDKLAAEEEAKNTAYENSAVSEATYKGEKGGFWSSTNDDVTANEVNTDVGTNVTVSLYGKDYYLEVGGVAKNSDSATLACQTGEIDAGRLFINDKKLYMSRGKDAAPIILRERSGITLHGNDYSKLYGELTAEKTIDRAYSTEIIKNDIDRGLEKGDWFTVGISDDQGNEQKYKVKSGGAIDEDAPIYSAAETAGIYDGEVFAYGDEAYVMRNGKIYSIDTRLLFPKQEEKMISALAADTTNPSELETTPNKESTKFVDVNQSYKQGDTFEVQNPAYDRFKVKVDKIVSKDSDAYKAMINSETEYTAGESFAYKNSVYVVGKVDSNNGYLYKLVDNEGAKALSNSIANVTKNGTEAKVMADSQNNLITFPEKIDTTDMQGQNLTITSSYNNYGYINDYISNSRQSNTGDKVVTQISVNGIAKNVVLDLFGTYTSDSDVYKAAAAKGLNKDSGYVFFTWYDRVYIWCGPKNRVVGIDRHLNPKDNSQKQSKEMYDAFYQYLAELNDAIINPEDSLE